MFSKSIILRNLEEIERKEKIEVLYAVESGSRAWGFASKDSDYDVRFIYSRPIDWYLSISDKKDNIEHPVSAMLDISGWDIKKTLNLFKKSNPPLYEWLNSPMVYLEKGSFAQSLRDLIPKFYSIKSSLHHYLHMAEGNYREYLKREEVRIKKYFYVLRPILACMWIEKHKTIPPMEFEKLLQAQRLDGELVGEIGKLLKRKRAGDELDIERRIEIINDFLENKLAYFEEYATTAKKEKKENNDVLDSLFRDVVNNQSEKTAGKTKLTL